MKEAFTGQTSRNGSASRYHVVIVGGGLVGLSMAVALSSLCTRDHGRSLRIAVIEAGKPGEFESFERSPRCTALSYGSRLIYESLGIWERIQPHVQPILDIHVSERSAFGTTRLSSCDYSLPALGYVIGNGHLLGCLAKTVRALDNVTFFCPATVERLDILSDRVSVCIREDKEKRELETELVILADGGGSPLMTQAGFYPEVSEYGHTAILAAVTHEREHGGSAFEHFTDEGPMALLPLIEKNKSTLIWTMPHLKAEERLQLTDDDFLAELVQRFGTRLGDFPAMGNRLSFPLTLRTVSEPARRGVLLLGNAAHSLHPVAGQGYNLSLRDTMTLARLLTEAPASVPLGSLFLLQEYLERQQSDQATTTLFSDWLVRAFYSSDPLIRHGRNAGLFLLDRCKPLKRWFGLKTMGLGGYGR